MIKDENVLNYKNHLWLKISIVVLLLLVISYIFYTNSIQNPNGATFVGLLYGILGLIAIIALMYYGIRKRSYMSNIGTLKGWLSSHIYIGILTLIIVPLHAGFKFGMNVHTLAYVLMAIVVISGIFGAYFYLNFPTGFTRYGKELLYNQFDEEINKLINQMRTISRGKASYFKNKTEEAVLLGIPNMQKGWQLLVSNATKDLPSQSDYLRQIKNDMNKIPEVERADYELISVLSLQKIELQKRFLYQMKIKNILEAWLYIHLPVSFVMIVALTIHIVSEIYYNGFSMFIP